VDEVLGTPMRGRRVRLERLEPRHVGALHRMATSDEGLPRWPLLGRRMTVEELDDHLWQLGRLNYAIVRHDTGAVVGLVQGIDEDPRSGTIGVAIFLDPRLWRAGWPLEGVLIFANHLLHGRGFRKLYFTVPASVSDRLGRTVDPSLVTECIHRRHLKVDDGYEDLYVLALHRDRWDESLAERVLTGRPASGT
jgi:Acetyltransferase (GNAT) domain